MYIGNIYQAGNIYKFHLMIEEIKMVVDKQTLQQTYSPKEVQVAFKILMTHWILQFALRIAFRCVLHRYRNLDIR